MSDEGEFDSDDCVRCPACGSVEDVSDFEGALYDEGTQGVSCGECGHDYDVRAEVWWTFTSPPRLPSEGK